MTPTSDPSSIPAAAVPVTVAPNAANDLERSQPRVVPTLPLAGETVASHHAVLRGPKSTVWGVPFDQVTMSQTLERIEQLVRSGIPSYVITANLNYVMLHQQDETMHRITEDADLILADGQPIVWRSRWGRERLPERVAGSELIYRLAHRASQLGWAVYFLGGKPSVAQACADRLCQRYPGLRVAGVESPPFRELTDSERKDQTERIRRSGASLLLVAFGQPKGERWIHEHYRQLGVPVSIQLGASFDFVAGTAKRAPRAWQRLGAEWAYRMLCDPKRLVPRYAANARFLATQLIEELRGRQSVG